MITPMKRILNLTMLLGLLWACNPMEDTYNNLDEARKPYKENIIYTLDATDYSNASKYALADAQNHADSASAQLIKDQQAFNQRFTAKNYVGKVLANRFVALNLGSTANVTYNVNLENTGYLTAYSSPTLYTLTSDNYQSVGGAVANTGYFIPSMPAEEFIPQILTAAISSPTANQQCLVSYKSSDFEPSSTTTRTDTLFKENFNENNLDKFDTVSVKGAQKWAASAYSGNYFAKISGYSGGVNNENEDWLIIPAIDLSGVQSATLNFTTAWKYDGNDLLLKYSTNYSGSGDPNAASWTNLSFDLGTGNFVFCPSGNVPLPKAKIYIAFVYTSTTSASRTWEVDDVVITAKVLAKGKSVTADLFKNYNDYYRFTGSKWEKSKGVLCVQPFEYSLMGLTGNAFTNTNPASRYIPTYLSQKYPYAQDGDTCIMVYNYPNANTKVAGKYQNSAGSWMVYNGIVQQSGQFIHTGEHWIFDPTVHLTPSASDLQLLVDYVYLTYGRQYGSSYGNDEFYFGASAYYKNFDLRLSTRSQYNVPGFAELATDEEKIALTWQRLQEGLTILLKLKYANDAVLEVDGIPVYYWVTFNTYENDLAKKTYVGIFKCTQPAPDPIFERDQDAEDLAVSDGKLLQSVVSWNREK